MRRQLPEQRVGLRFAQGQLAEELHPRARLVERDADEVNQERERDKDLDAVLATRRDAGNAWLLAVGSRVDAIADANGLAVFDAPHGSFAHELALAFGDAIGKNIYLALSGGELHFGRLPARRFLASPPWLPTLVFGVDAVRSVRRGGIGGGSWVVAWRCGFVLCQPLPEALIVRLP